MGALGRFLYTGPTDWNHPVLRAQARSAARMVNPCLPGTLAMTSDSRYPRDLIGYGRQPVQADWPGGARIAVQFVLNYEEGGENCILHGDSASEQFLSEIVGAAAYPARHMSMESIYEYGSRAGVWRILREFGKRGLPLTVFGVGMAIERNPEVAHAFVEAGHEIACHGWRWIHYQDMSPEREAEHMRLAMEAIERVAGVRPLTSTRNPPQTVKAETRPPEPTKPN